MTIKKIAVIGAGPMGLAVAYQLALDGHKPVVFEADDRVGGMTASFDFDGVDIERYYHFHCTSDTAFFEILKELGIENKLQWVKTKMGYWYQGTLQPWGNPFALLKFRGLGLIAKFRYGLHAFLSVKRNNWRPLEKTDASSWIKSWVGDEAYRVLWQKLLEHKFYHHTSNLSAPWIWSRIRRIGRSRYSLFAEKLGYLNGGSGTLLTALHQRIESLGGVVKLKHPIEKIIIKNGQVTGVQSLGASEPFDAVVSTVPLPLVARMAPDLSADLRQKFSDKKNIAVVCVIVKLTKPLTENFWLNTNDDEMDIPGIIEYGNLNSEKGHIAYVPYYMPRENPKFQDDDTVFADKVRRYFKRINPALTDSDFKSIKIHRYHFAQPICEPNYLETLAPEKVMDGFWAADTSFYYPEDRGISESIGYGRAMAKRVGND